MEKKHSENVFCLDLAYIYSAVPEAGCLIFGRLGLTDIYNLALVNKQFRDIIRNYGYVTRAAKAFNSKPLALFSSIPLALK